MKISLAVLVVSVALLSAAWADRQAASSPQPAPSAPAAKLASERQAPAPDTQCAAESATPAQAALDALLAPATPQAAGGTAAACPTGQVWTCCSCGCGCRRSNISPTNFCKFYLCG